MVKDPHWYLKIVKIRGTLVNKLRKMFGKEEKVVMVRGNSMLYQKLFIASWHLIPIAFYGKEQTNEQIFVLLKERKIDFVLLTLRRVVFTLHFFSIIMSFCLGTKSWWMEFFTFHNLVCQEIAVWWVKIPRKLTRIFRKNITTFVFIFSSEKMEKGLFTKLELTPLQNCAIHAQ